MSGNLTFNGMKAFNKIYDQFRLYEIERSPGINENDIERHFLYTLLQGMRVGHGLSADLECLHLIERIR